MVNPSLLKLCLENESDYSPQCTGTLEAAYWETGNVEFLNEATRRKMAAAVWW